MMHQQPIEALDSQIAQGCMHPLHYLLHPVGIRHRPALWQGFGDKPEGVCNVSAAPKHGFTLAIGCGGIQHVHTQPSGALQDAYDLILRNLPGGIRDAVG
ncbi:hypothetical protein NLP59_24035, partial [Escherichia coli]|nr:hypothetical protein [Escherichia coli]